MKAFFKESDKIIINSMTYDEALVGKTFLNNLEGKALKAEQRNDINDDFDGLVLTIGGPAPTEEEIQKRIDDAVAEVEAARIKEFTLDLNKETLSSGEYVISNLENLQVITNLCNCVLEYDTPVLKVLLGEELLDTVLTVYGFDKSSGESAAYATFKAQQGETNYACELGNDGSSVVTVDEEGNL